MQRFVIWQLCHDNSHGTLYGCDGRDTAPSRVPAIRGDISKIRLLSRRLPVPDPMTPQEEITLACWRATEQALEALTKAVYDLEQAAEKARSSR